MGAEKMLTAKEFAEATEISYPVIIAWLKRGRVPGAEQTSFNVWQIPASIVDHFLQPENRPRKGRPPRAGTKPKATAQTGRKASKKAKGN